jgi:hypothetical protein
MPAERTVYILDDDAAVLPNRFLAPAEALSLAMRSLSTIRTNF